jgi:hypothetical protein
MSTLSELSLGQWTGKASLYASRLLAGGNLAGTSIGVQPELPSLFSSKLSATKGTFENRKETGAKMCIASKNMMAKPLTFPSPSFKTTSTQHCEDKLIANHAADNSVTYLVC